MVDISNNFLISMNPGDYFRAPIFINAGDKLEPLRYIMQDQDELYFAITEPGQPFEAGIVRKVLKKESLNQFGDPVLELNYNDTSCLVPGDYFYEIKLSTPKTINSSDGTGTNVNYLDTIVTRRRFTIL